MKAVAYYRTRPSEPEASDMALRLQREAVRQRLDKGELGELTIVAEFIEREGESDPETYPAFAAAAQVAADHSSGDGTIDVGFLIASAAAIGTGEPFREPDVPGAHKIFWIQIAAPSIPTRTEIALPKGAPGPLCIHAVFHPRQLDTLIYLCNASAEPLEAVTVMSKTIEMATFFQEEGDDRWANAHPSEQCWDVVPPTYSILINQLGHKFWDNVTCYQLSYADASGQRWQTETYDCNLCVCEMPESEQAWVEFGRPELASATNPFGPERS